MKLILVLTSLFLMTVTSVLAAPGDIDYRNRTTLGPNDYLFGSYGKRRDPVFDDYRTVELNVDLGIGSDCGRINFKNTLQGALKNILDAKYLGDIGKDILAGSPLLLTCYMSPTWCAILKHSQIQANFLGQMRLNQCAVMDKYVDSRVEDFYQERQQCVQKAIQETGGNFEEAMEKCKNYWDANLSNWAGDKYGNKTPENRLFESTAKWAGFQGAEANRTVSLLKAFVGDTIIRKGTVSVDFGPNRVQLTPRTYLMRLENDTFSKLCGGVLDKVTRNGGYKANIDRLVTDQDLKDLSGDSDNPLIDRQTIRSLAYMPSSQRALACRKLSDAISMTVFSTDMTKSMDFLTSKVGSNPYLPENRKQEAERKRKALKDQVEMTLALYRNKNEPLNQVLSQVNSDGMRYQGEAIGRKISIDRSSQQSEHNTANFFDCADGTLCE